MKLRGYTLIETLVAVAVLLMGIAAAATMAMTIVSYEEASARVARALNYQEQAGRLFQLGLSTNEILAILPPESSATSLTFTLSTNTFINIGAMETSTCTLTFTTGTALTQTSGTAVQRVNNIVLVRPTIR